ncbi:MAG: hypothetical protein HZB24_09610 [Desulfobacterales bacterium]|nr:hypothetical protein [Desulfobacterales bacterium]
MSRFNHRILIAAGVPLLLGACCYLFFAHVHSAPPPGLSAPAKADSSPETMARRSQVAPSAQATGKSSATADDEALRQVVTMQVIVAKLLDAYANTIDHPRIRLQAIQMLVNYLKQAYPDTWREHVEQYLRAAFPEQADRLYAQFLLWEEYTAWMQGNYQATIAMPADQRRDFIWAKRKQFFGEEATLIWAKEIEEQQVSDAVAELGQLRQAPFEEKAAYYNARLEEIYADQFEAYKRKYPQKVMDQFLSAEDVQEDLRNMPPDQRQARLDDFRRSIGMNEEAVKRWSDLDGTRETRWQTGETYMQRRAQILNEKGDDAELDSLGNELFGAEAQTIKDEEESGYFRFQRKRIYGQN